MIAAAIGGLGELVADGETGLLVPPARRSRSRAAIVELAADLRARPGWARRAGACGRDVPQERCTDRTEPLYRRELGEASA